MGVANGYRFALGEPFTPIVLMSMRIEIFYIYLADNML